ncbi:MAG: universal stress protein A [Paraglaciecola sp.]|jgi:universal stress protein A
MHDYQKILVAIDVYSSYELVLDKAINIANKPADISLVYVTLPHVYFEPYGAAFGGDFVSEMRQQAELKLKEIAKTHGIPAEQIYANVGAPADEIHHVAKDLEADLIVIGTQGKSGLKLLLGSTANGVLHGVKCDVLAAKV